MVKHTLVEKKIHKNVTFNALKFLEGISFTLNGNILPWVYIISFCQFLIFKIADKLHLSTLNIISFYLFSIVTCNIQYTNEVTSRNTTLPSIKYYF